MPLRSLGLFTRTVEVPRTRSLPLTAFYFLLSWHPHEVFANGMTDNQESPAHCFVFPPFLSSVPESHEILFSD